MIDLFGKAIPEIVDCIVSLVQDRPTLLALCFVSKNVNRIATAHLYAEIDLSPGLKKGNPSYLHPLGLFLFTSKKRLGFMKSFAIRSIGQAM